jgi:hypothetical protein
MAAEWVRVQARLPDEGVVVDTKIDDASGVRIEQPLKLMRNLWWLADSSMYVYYAPTHWAAIDSAAKAAESEG